LDEKLSNVKFVVVVNIMRWQKTSGLGNQSSPTLTTPKCIIIKKLSSKYLFCIHTRMNPSIFERTHSMPKLSKKAIFIKEYEAVVASWVRKAYIRFCLDDEDSFFEDEIDECMIKELAVMKASRYIFWASYRQWETTWECVLYDCKYLTDDEFLSHFRMYRSCVMQLNSLVEGDQEFRSVSRKLGKRSSMLHIMVLLNFLGSYRNEAAL